MSESTVPSISRPTPEAPSADTEIRVGFIAGALQELRRVVWPTREELLRMTAVVVFTVAAIAAFIAAMDAILTFVTKPLYGNG